MKLIFKKKKNTSINKRRKQKDKSRFIINFQNIIPREEANPF